MYPAVLELRHYSTGIKNLTQIPSFIYAMTKILKKSFPDNFSLKSLKSLKFVLNLWISKTSNILAPEDN